MKKILLYNLNVGSGVEYTGNVIADWCKELDCFEFFEHKTQDPPCFTVNSIIEHKPDIIIINDNTPKVYEPPYYYKRFFPDVKVIYLTHGIKEIDYKYIKGNSNSHYIYDLMTLHIGCRDYFEKVVSFGFIRTEDDIPASMRNKLLKGHFPVNPEEYKIHIPWSKRKNLFCNVGQLNNLKFSSEFLNVIKNHKDIKVDCYGGIHKDYTNPEYRNLLKIPQIKYFGYISQNKVSEVLNQYKYFILPHGRDPEIFNITLLQACFCGTIPLVCNDRTANFDYKWIDWADGLYIAHNKEEDLLKSMIGFMNDDKDYTFVSNQISQDAMRKYDYFKFKGEFQTLLKGWL